VFACRNASGDPAIGPLAHPAIAKARHSKSAARNGASNVIMSILRERQFQRGNDGSAKTRPAMFFTAASELPVAVLHNETLSKFVLAVL
jgi:hypothetical protein